MFPTPQRTPGLDIPGWGLDPDLYGALCRYLGFTPDPALHVKVSRYLLGIAAQRPAPTGFARWLAALRPGRMALGFLDIGTRLAMPTSPWRYRFNAIIAIHECDPRGYREMMAGPDSRIAVWASAIFSVISLILNLVPGLLWLGGQAGLYLLAARVLRRERECFAGSTVLVTGASRGLGLAMVARLLSLDARVVAVARDSDALRALREQARETGWAARLRIIAADVAEPRAITEGLNAAGLEGASIDMAIINAGIKEQSAGPDAEAAIARTFAVNVFGAVHTANALLADWRARGSGRLVFISSMGRWHGMAKTGAYNASKAALSILAESMVMDLRAKGADSIKITVVEPGLIRTDMVGQGFPWQALSVDAPAAARRILQSAARGRAICRFPFLFVLMTAVIAALPLRWRVRILGRASNSR